jgi:hypothetical protein
VLAAALTLVVAGWRFYQDHQMHPNDDRLAIAWAETVASGEGVDSLALNWPDSFLFDDAEEIHGEARAKWLGDLAADEIGEIAASEIAASEIAAGEFAAGDDSPPQWLLVAISQMPTESASDTGDDVPEATDPEFLQ